LTTIGYPIVYIHNEDVNQREKKQWQNFTPTKKSAEQSSMLWNVGGVLKKAKKDMLSGKSSALSDNEVDAENQSGVHQQIQQNMLWKFGKSLINVNTKTRELYNGKNQSSCTRSKF